MAAREIEIDLWAYWYGPCPVTGKSRRHLKQERFVFGPHTEAGCPAYQGALTARRWGKNIGLTRKIVLLLFLNPGDLDEPVWGGLFGRTVKEAEKRLLRPVLAELRRIKRDLGVDMMPRWNKAAQELVFPNGAGIILASYGKQDALQRNRGDTLGWAAVDELERSFMSIEDVLSVIGVAISDHRARHSCFVWLSSPNGLAGMARKHHEAWQRGDRRFWLVTGTIFDNPFLSPDQVQAIKAGLSKRMWLQEGGGVCLAPGSVVFVEYDERKHVVDYEWDPSHLTLISVDWGTSKGSMGAIKVTPDGRWIVAREKVVVETSPAQYRQEVLDFIEECYHDDGGRLPHRITCDSMPKDERKWLANTFSGRTEVKWLRKDQEQGIGWGLNLISFMLDPAADDLETSLFFASSLDPDTDPLTMGIRGSMAMYGYARERIDTGEVVATNTPSKKGGADHAIDWLRYAVCKGRKDKMLHGGRELPFNDPTLDAARADRALRRYDRTDRRDEYDEAA
jgi:hypothetical protein